MSLHDYLFEHSEDVHRRFGASVFKLEIQDLDGALVRFEASLAFGRDFEGVLIAEEFVYEAEDGRAHRLQYSYHAMYRDRFLFRYDRDPDNHPEMVEHKHLPPDERRIPWGRVTLQEVVDDLYELLGEIEPGDDSP